MNQVWSFEDIAAFGKEVDGVLEIKDSFTIDKLHDGSMQCVIVSAMAAYKGEKAPKIYFELSDKDQDTSLCPYHLGWINLLPYDANRPIYSSHLYRIGKREEYVFQSWRVPPMFLRTLKITMRVEIPEGTTLCIKTFGAEYNSATKPWDGGLRFNAHLGFWGLAPENTMRTFELAAVCGFPACIVVPKATKDGVLVCLHDETLTKTARDENGNPPSEELFVSEMTYEELLKWDFGTYRNKVFKGTRIPLLEDFFALCSRTGMRPMFSTHPDMSTEDWLRIKAMLKKYGLLKSFHIKSGGLDIIEHAYSIFGTEIEGYTWDKSAIDEELVRKFDALGIDKTKCRVGIEVQMGKYTPEIAKMITDAGYFAAAWAIKRRDFEEYERLIEMGVTEFTEDYHCSMGLNFQA